MTMVTVPLAVLIGAGIGMLMGGCSLAAGNNETGEYILATFICCVLFILLSCGAETLINLGGV